MAPSSSSQLPTSSLPSLSTKLVSFLSIGSVPRRALRRDAAAAAGAAAAAAATMPSSASKVGSSSSRSWSMMMRRRPKVLLLAVAVSCCCCCFLGAELIRRGRGTYGLIGIKGGGGGSSSSTALKGASVSTGNPAQAHSPAASASNDANKLTTTSPRSPNRVYCCGWRMCLADAIFPDAAAIVHLEDMAKDEAESVIATFRNDDDVLMYNCGGPCPLSSTTMDQLFPGPILTINGESDPQTCQLGNVKEKRSRIVALDRIGGRHKDDDERDGDAWRKASTYYAGLVLASQPQQLRREFLVDRSIGRSAPATSRVGDFFLMYANSHCVPYREQAFRKLAAIGPVHYGGACRGQHTSWWRGMLWFPQTPVGHKSDDVRGSVAGWGGNRQLFRHYRFVLCMENAHQPGYISEKILVAFLARAIPIYYGTTEIFDVFNPDAFVYYDIEHPQAALDRVAYLERNQTAYREVLQEPILAHGQETYDKYFSLWDDADNGVGRLKWVIRERIGFGRGDD